MCVCVPVSSECDVTLQRAATAAHEWGDDSLGLEAVLGPVFQVLQDKFLGAAGHFKQFLQIGHTDNKSPD